MQPLGGMNVDAPCATICKVCCSHRSCFGERLVAIADRCNGRTRAAVCINPWHDTDRTCRRFTLRREELSLYEFATFEESIHEWRLGADQLARHRAGPRQTRLVEAG